MKGSKVRIALVGGGSVNWSPGLTRDFLLCEDLEEIEFRFLDFNVESARLMKRFGEKICSDWGRDGITFVATSDSDRALEEADFVLITIATGGLEATEYDLVIPERYGIYQTVGDTVGPGGWARSLRNIPVFASYADRIKRVAPAAVILNYSNPMAALTGALCRETSQPVVGLCHAIIECRALLRALLSLAPETDIRFQVAGVNHFFWNLDIAIEGKDAYSMLQERLEGTDLNAAAVAVHTDGADFAVPKLLASELFEHYGCLPYVGDRHTSEFLGCCLTSLEGLERYGLKRTSVGDRRKGLAPLIQEVQQVLAGEKQFEKKRSHETAADIVASIHLGRDLVDVMNLPNRGQIANLPMGAIVETMGVANSLGFTPLSAGPLPQPLLNLVLPHAVNQLALLDASFMGDRTGALQVLADDPLCRHLPYARVREMGMALMEAHKAYLPQFA